MQSNILQLIKSMELGPSCSMQVLKNFPVFYGEYENQWTHASADVEMFGFQKKLWYRVFHSKKIQINDRKSRSKLPVSKRISEHTPQQMWRCLGYRRSYDTGCFIQRRSKLMIINHTVSYRWVKESVNTRLSRCGDAWVTEEAMIQGVSFRENPN
jgi:hypothetical protein